MCAVGWRAVLHARLVAVHGVPAVLVPPVALGLIAVAAGVAALRLGAVVLAGGSWAWLGDTAFALGALAVLAFFGLPAAFRRERLKRSGLSDVDTMTGDEFEARLAVLFDNLGFAVTRTGASGDFGADLVLERDDRRVVVQAKRYDGAVGIEAVQQVIGATRYYDAIQAIVVTNSACTPAATKLAKAHDVVLVERDALAALLAAYPLDRTGSGALSVLAREVVGGVTLVLFAAGRILRLTWWVLGVALRLPMSALRARR